MLKTEFKFSLSIIFIFLILIIPAFIGLLVFVYVANNKIADSISNNLIERFRIETTLSVRELINPTRRLVNSAASLANVNSNFFNNDKSWDYLKSILSQQESTLSAYVGSQDGSFRQVRRVYADTKIQDKAITSEMAYGFRWISKERTVDSYIFVNEKGEKIDTSTKATDYDARTRPWFKEAVAKKKLILTEPYIFSTTGLPGLTVAAPFFSKSEIAGVVAADISLDSISKFLLSQSISASSLSIIYDSAGIVIASSVQKDIFKKINNRVTYTIFDTKEVNLIQYYYLNMLNLKTNWNLIKKKQINIINRIDKINSGTSKNKLFIANWSLSETPTDIRDKIIKKFSKFNFFLITFQSTFEDIDNYNYFSKLSKDLTENNNNMIYKIKKIPFMNFLNLKKTHWYLFIKTKNM